jgi:hypothetical protein
MENWIQHFVGKFPARVDFEDAGKILGFNVDEVRILVSHGALVPIAKPKQNAHKFFALTEIAEKFLDKKWLSKSTEIIYKHWNNKNESKNSLEN